MIMYDGKAIGAEWIIQGAVIILIINILRVLLLKKVMDLFLAQGGADARKRKLGFGGYYLLTAVCYGIFHVSVPYEVCNCLGIIGLTLFYRETWKKRIWISLVLFSMDLACSLAVFFAFKEAAVLPQLLAIQVFLLFICVMLISRIQPYVREETISGGIDLDIRQTLLLLMIPAAGIFILCILLYGKIDGMPALLICAAALVINLSVFWLYHVMVESYTNIREKDIYRQQMYAYQNQLEVIMESQNRIRALKHDMKNHILALQMLLQKKEEEEAEKYLSSMQLFLGNPSEHVTTGNDAVDSLLNYKIQKAKDILNVVETRISIPEKLILHSFDLNVVLGNLLDNAIDAAAQTKEKSLQVTMRFEKGILFLNIRNSCQGIADGKISRLETTKADKANHGIGLQNVRRIVEKYHGMMEISCENGNMEVDIMLYGKEM